MASSWCKISIISAFVFFKFFMVFVCPVKSFNFNHTNQDFRPGDESKKLNLIRAHLMKINKPGVKTIQSPDGDIIDCVLSHKQPAFDHPQLKGQKPLDPPELPKGHKSTTGNFEENFQVWSMFNESCPEGTIPIRRTTEQDLVRVRQYGTKIGRPVRRDDINVHEYAVAYVDGGEFYGAKAVISVWAPVVANKDEFSLAQLWVVAGPYDVLNTVEAGWQVYGDKKPRLFIFWTSDGYKSTGCYNLQCSGFVQTNNKIALGAAISPTSTYGGRQFDITLLVWKNPGDGNWWLTFGNGIAIGYWPSLLFTNLKDHADSVQYGGEIINIPNSGGHTSTQMGSGHFAEEGPGKAAYFRNLQVVDSGNKLNAVSNIKFLAEKPNCYDVRQGKFNSDRENYFYYGGPGKNPNCP